MLFNTGTEIVKETKSHLLSAADNTEIQTIDASTRARSNILTLWLWKFEKLTEKLLPNPGIFWAWVTAEDSHWFVAKPSLYIAYL